MTGVVALQKEPHVVAMLGNVPSHPGAWRERVRHVVNVSLLPASPQFIVRETATAPMSMARRHGHATITELIENGFGMKWEAWQTEVRAFLRSEQYQIHGVTAADVMAQYDGVEIHLGRAPISAQEFHEKRHTLNVLERQRLEGAIAQSAEQLRQLNQALSVARSSLGHAQDELRRTRDQHEHQVSQLETQLTEMQARELATPEDMAKFRGEALAALQAHLEDVGQQTINGISRLVEELPRARDGAVASSLRSQLTTLTAAHQQTQEQLGQAIVTISEKEQMIATLEQQIEKLTLDVTRLSTQVEELSVLGTSNPAVVEALECELKALQQRCQSLQSSNTSLDAQQIRLRDLAKRQSLQLRAMNERLKLARLKTVPAVAVKSPSMIKRILRAIVS